MTPSRDIVRLLEIMAALRTPGTGCPWDLQQNFATIAPYTLEEAYEVADAIVRDDLDDLRDELGDLLLQVVFHARMAEEAGHFAFHDVATAISAKLETRHPHIFGETPDYDFGTYTFIANYVPTGIGSRNLGVEADFTLAYKFSKDLQLTLAYDHFFTEKFFREASGSSKDVGYASAMLTFNLDKTKRKAMQH
jgi:NTP pyrophosphatase (non-canonical NTP hydrolase)